MSIVLIKDLEWFSDTQAITTGEPGICHSYLASVATVLRRLNPNFDPVWMMGTSGFAFRISINETMCPSAMSMFNWKALLPEAVAQSGFDCRHICRLWNEKEHETARRDEAHSAIITAIDDGVPAVVWDIHNAEWGVIFGYDPDQNNYLTLTHTHTGKPGTGAPGSLAYDKLGSNGIDILSVIIVEARNRRSRKEVIQNAMAAAVTHAQQREWTDRPNYQNGLAAYDLWATMFERWARIVEKGDPDKIVGDLCLSAEYYAAHYYSARCYAREFLNNIAGRNPILHQAASCYGTVAERLEPVWKNSPKTISPNPSILRELALAVREAKEAETEGVGFLHELVTATG
jgi:hypothetical protein